MKYRTRTYYTDGQKALMWERWRQGWTLHQIAHLFARAHTSVRGVLAQSGGIRPPQRSRCAIALTLVEREEISRSVAEGQSIRSIAAQLRQAPSTVSREIRRNGGQAHYRATATLSDIAVNRKQTLFKTSGSLWRSWTDRSQRVVDQRKDRVLRSEQRVVRRIAYGDYTRHGKVLDGDWGP